MLKKELQEQLDAAHDLIGALRTEANVSRDLIKSAAEKAGEHRRLVKHVDSTKTAIASIVMVNCADQIDWEEKHKYIDPNSDEGMMLPEPPESTELYRSLRHIEKILNRPITEQETDTRFRY